MQSCPVWSLLPLPDAMDCAFARARPGAFRGVQAANSSYAHGSCILETDLSALIRAWPSFDLCMGLQGQVHVAVRKLLAAYPDEVGSITTTGHSLGGALASLCAFDLVCSFPLRLFNNVLASQWKGIPYAHMVSAMHKDGLLSGADPNTPEHLIIQTHGTGGTHVC